MDQVIGVRIPGGQPLFEIKREYSMKYGIRITSWRGISFNAIHFYGKAWAYNEEIGDRICRIQYNPDKDRFWDAEGNEYEDPYFEEDIEHEMTSEEARILNEKDQSISKNMGYQKGDITYRFDTEDQVIEKGIQLLTEKYGKDIVIIDGERYDEYEEENIVYDKGRVV